MTPIHAFCGFVFRGALRLLPSALRERHGDAMLALYLDELRQREHEGAWAVWHAATAGLLDLLFRGVYEHLCAERALFRDESRHMIRRVAPAFLLAFVGLTSAWVANYLLHQRPDVLAAARPALVFYAIPFTASLTVPMALFVAVLSAGTDRRRHPEPSANSPESGAPHRGIRLVPLIAMASLVSLFALAWNAEVVPRANQQLIIRQTGNVQAPLTDRSMTLGQLRAASQQAARHPREVVDRNGHPLEAQYDFEIHKKFALAAACLVLALLAAGLTRQRPQAGMLTVAVTSLITFSSYYVLMMGGETLVDRGAIPPAIGMWSANALMLLLAVWALGTGRAPRRRALTAD